ncbi:hypothetical protein BDR04DRAFT_1154933 [Suillus decipiens]|nr:hypothetical protein BDR04DRAFT_1154933 [Suillus decipiens]
MKSDIIRKRSRHGSHAQRSFRLPSASNTPGTPSATLSQTKTPSMSPGDTYAVYNLFHGPYHPELGAAQEFGSNASPNTSASNVPYNNADTTNTNSNSNSSTTGRHTAKRRRMNTDNVSEPPSSAVSYGGDMFTTGSGATSAGTSSSSHQGLSTLFRGNGYNTFSWYHSSNGGSAKCSLQFVQPPMLPEAAGTSDGHSPQLHQFPPRRPLC